MEDRFFSAQWWQHGTMLKTRRLPGPVREHRELIAEFGFVVHASPG
jgi:hypothetical protein